MTENAVFVVRAADRDEAVAEGLTGDDILGENIEIEESRLVDVALSDDTARGALVDDFGT